METADYDLTPDEIRDGDPPHAGLVSYRRSRQTGTTIGVYQAQVAGIESDADAGRWATVCEEHAGVVLHPTRAVAMSWSAYPRDWCPTCQVE